MCLFILNSYFYFFVTKENIFSIIVVVVVFWLLVVIPYIRCHLFSLRPFYTIRTWYLGVRSHLIRLLQKHTTLKQGCVIKYTNAFGYPNARVLMCVMKCSYAMFFISVCVRQWNSGKFRDTGAQYLLVVFCRSSYASPSCLCTTCVLTVEILLLIVDRWRSKMN